MRTLAPPPRHLHCFRRTPKTPYKRTFANFANRPEPVGQKFDVKRSFTVLRLRPIPAVSRPSAPAAGSVADVATKRGAMPLTLRAAIMASLIGSLRVIVETAA